MLNVFDSYSRESQDLLHSMKESGFDHPTVVLEPNGFLPDGVESPFIYFLGQAKGEKRGRYFNEVPVPDFWEVSGDNSSGKVTYYGQEKARIVYHAASYKRIVERLEWLDDKGQVVMIERFDQYGRKIAVTTCGDQGQHLVTTYFEGDIERLTENHQTGDLILTLDHQPMQIFKNRLDYFVFYLEYRGFDLDGLVYNTLATSFSISLQLGNKGIKGRDVLVWQEPLHDSLPGNMQLILKSPEIRTKKILIPQNATYHRALQLTSQDQHSYFGPLGYLYDFKVKDDIRKDAFVLTNSDQIEALTYLVENLPNVTFRVAALTEMSASLLSMVRYPNVVLYQFIWISTTMQRCKALFARPSNTSKSSLPLAILCMTATSSHKPISLIKEKKQIWWPVSRKSTNLWITTEKPSRNKLPNQVALSQLFSKLACKKG